MIHTAALRFPASRRIKELKTGAGIVGHIFTVASFVRLKLGEGLKSLISHVCAHSQRASKQHRTDLVISSS